jgi:DNA-directed RNA polymerase specialized sigma subunit
MLKDLDQKILSIESLKAKALLEQISLKRFTKKEWLARDRKYDRVLVRHFKLRLPEHERMIIHLRYWEGLSFEVIAGMTEQLPKLAEEIHDLAIKRLRTYFQEFNFKCGTNIVSKEVAM